MSSKDLAPDISIVIPTHGSRFLSAAVQSVIEQTIEDWELVIVDNGSRDGTAQVAARFAAADPRVRVATQSQNEGIVSARNLGLRSISARSRYVAFLDHDDVWMRDSLALLKGALFESPTASASHGKAIRIDASGNRILSGPAYLPATRLGIVEGRLTSWPDSQPTTFANLAYEDCVVSMGSGLIRRAVLDSIGGFDTRAEGADDYDMWIRLSRRGELTFVNRVVLAYRVHRDPNRGSLRPPPRRGQGTPYVRYKMIASPENTPRQRRMAIAGFRSRQRRLFGEQWSDLEALLKRREYRRTPAHVVGLAARLVAFAHGRPWSWHR